jgi:iron complex transport system ATP-binding protein
MVQAEVLELAGRNVMTLSGGERARVLLARALAVEAPILLADEPVASLDPYHQLQVMELLRDCAKKGAAVLVVLHNLTLAGRFCDRLVLLRAGAVLADGPPGEVLASGVIERAYQVQTIAGTHAGQSYVLPWARLER